MAQTGDADGDRDAIRATIQAILRDILEDDALVIHDDTVAADVPFWDSHNHIRLLLLLAQEFSFQLKSEEITAPATVGELVDQVRTKL